jgi:hypothetical protein
VRAARGLAFAGCVVPDNTELLPGGGGDRVATASLSFSGDTAKVQVISAGLLTGSEGSWSYTLLVGGAGAVGAGVQRVTLASDDPAVVTLGAKADTVATTDTGTFSLVALFKRLLQGVTTLIAQLPAALTGSGNLKVSLQESNAAQAVTGTFWQATQPVSIAATVTVDTELPAASAVSGDNVAAPTAPAVYAFGLAYDGANWDRLRGDSTDGLLVNLGANNDVTVTNTVTVSGSVTADTELPAAVALSDALGNPTAPQVGSSLLVWDTTQWFRARGDTTNGLDVDVTRVSGTVTVAGTVTANIGTSGSLALESGGNLATLAGGVTGSKYQANIAQVGGSAFALGQQVAASSLPVVLTAAQLSTLTPLTTVAVTGTFWQATQPVSLTSVPSHAVTNAGTFAVQVDGAALTSLQLIDDAVSGTGFNISQMNGVAVAMGNGVSGTGVQRVTLANDSTGQVALAAGSTVTSLTQFNGVAITLNKGASDAGTLRVSLGDGTQTIGALTANQSVNVAQVGGSTVATAATGVQKVGVVGNAGATVDGTVGAGTAPTNQVVVGSVYNTTAPAPANGQSMAQQADQAGNLRTAPGIATATLSAWNSGTSLNATQTLFSNSGAPAVLVQLTQTTTLTAGAVTAEVTYDGTNWVTISADAVLDPTSTTLAAVSLPYTVQASTNKALLLLAKGAQGMRLKLSTQITGSGSITPNYALLPYAPAQQTLLGAGSATIGALAANQSVNLAQVAGATTATGHGTASGAVRVELPTDGTGVLATVSTVTAVSTLTGGGVAQGSGRQRQPDQDGRPCRLDALQRHDGRRREPRR